MTALKKMSKRKFLVFDGHKVKNPTKEYINCIEDTSTAIFQQNDDIPADDKKRINKICKKYLK